MPLYIIRDDITRLSVSAIVNAANSTLLGGGGVDGAIHAAAGSGLLEECRKLGGCKTGEAKITAAYELPCRYVIHTVGPIYAGGQSGEAESLRSCYTNSLKLAKSVNCESVAFPLISAGAYGYPKAEALDIAVKAIGDYLQTEEMDVYLVIFDRIAFEVSSSRFEHVRSYIDEHYVSSHTDERSELSRFAGAQKLLRCEAEEALLDNSAISPNQDLSARLSKLDESFAQRLLRLIDEAGMTDSECYKRANIDRRLFSKIRSDPNYRPSKATALAFAVALRLDVSQTEQLLCSCGYALSHSSKFDVIVEYFLENGCYDIYEINEMLFAFDQTLLGAK